MLKARDVAEYFLATDKTGKLRDKTVLSLNNRTPYAGNVRLNKYLHIAQNLYIAKTGNKLFDDDLYAYDNGAVALEVVDKYSILINRKVLPSIPSDIARWLDKVAELLKNASISELIAISHEDKEWQSKCHYYDKQSQKMDSLAHAEEYKEQYADALYVLEEMV